MTTTQRLIASLVLLAACKPNNIERALDATNTALGATRIVIDETAERHKQLTADAVRACAAELGVTTALRGEPTVRVAILLEAATTPEQRHDCLARRGFAPEQIQRFEDALAKISEGYDLIVEALGLIQQGWTDAQTHLGGAQ